jgi:ABC-type transporter MlaC component
MKYPYSERIGSAESTLKIKTLGMGLGMGMSIGLGAFIVLLGITGSITLSAETKKPAAESKKPAAAAVAKSTASQQLAWNLANDLGNGIVKAAKRRGQTQKKFVSEVEVLLEKLINFEVFAGSVMGKYTTKEHLATLPKKKRARLQKRTKKFSETFKNQLIDVYSTTFWNAAKKAEVQTLPIKPSSKPNKQIIRQQILGVSEKPVEILYQMVFIDGQWQIKNLAVELINLAKIYRNQFYNLMKEHDDDIDAVIDAWHVSS